MKSQRSRAVTDPSTCALAGQNYCCFSTQEQACGLTPSFGSRAPRPACAGLSPLPEDPCEASTQAFHHKDIAKASSSLSWLEVMYARRSLQPWSARCFTPESDERCCSANPAGQLEAIADARTTLMLRNLPLECSRSVLISLLNALGFAGRYDFVYMPMDFSKGCSLGYAFVNVCSPRDATCLRCIFEGFSQWPTLSEKVCEVVWSEPHQGVAALVERYRNSPVMHPSVPDEWKPAVYVGGTRGAFPAPTRTLKAPKASRVRHGRA